MAGLFGVIKPSFTELTNLVTNPSGKSTTGYTATGSLTVNQFPPNSRRGTTSLQWSPNNTTNEYIYFTLPTLTSSDTCTFSLDIKAPLGYTFRMYFASSAGAIWGTPLVFTTNGEWQRFSVSTPMLGLSGRVYLDQNGLVQVATYRTDGWCVVSHGIDPVAAFDPGYIDGDQRDCFWLGAPHASASVRQANSREGGRELMFQDLGFYIDDAPGTGVPDIRLHSQGFSMLPGTQDLGYRVQGRAFSLVGYIVGTSIKDVHTKRQAIVDAVKPDLNPFGTGTWITYASTTAGIKTRIRARYAGGLDFGSVAGFQDGYRERVALRFYADDPFWYEDGDDGRPLGGTWPAVDSAYLVKRGRSETWGSLSTVTFPMTGTVHCMVAMPNGHVIIGGDFVNVGSANGDYIVDYDPVARTYSPLGTGTNGAVLALAVSPSGILYVGGNFTLAGGVASTTYLASWNGVAWSAVGAGAHGLAIVNALQFDRAGLLYIGGSSGAGTNGLKTWNGAAYATPGSGTAGGIEVLKLGPDGFIYLGGSFTAAGGVANTNKLACWNGTAYLAVGAGITTGSLVSALEFDPAGNLYVGGNYTVIGGLAIAYIAYWNGSLWMPLGDGVDGSVVVIAYIDNLIYVGGYFTKAGGITVAQEMAVWNGTAWAHIPLTLPSLGSPQVLLPLNGELYLGYDTTGTPTNGYRNSLFNYGSAISYPKITLKRTGGTSATVAYLKNTVTGTTIWLNYPLQDGETLTLDFSPSRRSCVSSVRGNVLSSAVLRSSDFANFHLLPGQNYVIMYVLEVGSPTMEYFATWPIAHWSLDGGVV